MRCHECGADVVDGQRFCQDCGASLRGVADVTAELPAVDAPSSDEPPQAPDRSASPFPPPAPGSSSRSSSLRDVTDDREQQPTVVMPIPGAARDRSMADHDVHPVPASEEPTMRVPVQPASSAAASIATRQRARSRDTTGQMPTQYAPDWSDGSAHGDRHGDADRRFRLRPLLVLAVVIAAGTAAAVQANMITIATDAGATAGFEVGDWKVNDFGTNNTVAAVVAASAMVVGALAWCFGARWGAGLAGGAGAALAGWSALLIGLAEWPIAEAQRAGVAVTVTRDVGYWAVAGAGAAGVVLLLLSLAGAGRDGHSGLDPWIAALGAASFLLAAGGPLIPQNDVGIEANYQSTAVDLPAMFFIGRMVQLGLFLLCGVVGFLMVRRYGLGLAIGGALAAGWMLVTAATDQTDTPIGPAYANPGATDLEPHAVTIVGMAMLGFFALVAVVMALLDSDR